MTDTLDALAGGGDGLADENSPDLFPCTEEGCTADPFPTALRLGAHKRQAHGIAGKAASSARSRRNRRAGKERPETPPRVGRPPKVAGTGDLEARFAATIATIGVGLHMMGQSADADVISRNAAVMARAATNVAAENERMRHLLEMVSGGSAWGEFLMVWLPVVIAIAANHNLVPDRFVPPGVRSPDAERRRDVGTPAPAEPPPPAPGPLTPVFNDDGSITLGDVTMPADQVRASAEAMGLDPSLFGAAEVTVNDNAAPAADHAAA